jgi:pimeloyl-ACP methyl ester carboxylesterase
MKINVVALTALWLAATGTPVSAAPAVQVLGRDFTFPQKIDGLPAKLSEFRDLQISSFTTNDGVKLVYWEAGEGSPVIFVPGWSANGAEYVNVMYLLSKHHRVIVLDQRNQGLSQTVDYGYRIARLSMDLKELTDHLGIGSADYCGWSMGASVLWSFIDLFGTAGIRKVVFVDEPISIVSHSDWSDIERRNAGSMAASPDEQLALMKIPPPVDTDPATTNFLARFKLRDSPYFANSEAFSEEFVHSDMRRMLLIMYDHAASDWRDVIMHRLDVPVAIFTGDYSANVPSQRWAASVINNSTLYVYSKREQGDHFLMFKNPVKFTTDLESFLGQ